MRSRMRQLAAVLIAPALGIAGLVIGAPGSGATTTPPGLSPTSVTIGALISETGFLSADFAPELDGVRAYLSTVNASGGVNGRTIDLKYAVDDQSSPLADSSLLHTLIQTDKVFAIVGVGTGLFNTKYAASSGTPTYGYATTGGWSPAPNLFAAYGSFSNPQASLPAIEYAMKQQGATKVAFVAYNVASSSSQCNYLSGQVAKEHFTVSYVDDAIGYGSSNFATDATRIKNSGANYWISCLDVNGSMAMQRALSAAGAGSVPSLWFDGYDRNLLANNPSVFAHTTLMVQHVPFEMAGQFPGVFPGLESYLTTMNAKYPNSTYSEAAMEGWLSAQLFVQGLTKAGKNPTQASVVKATNTITNFTGGVTTTVNWTAAHTKALPPGCSAFVTVSGTTFHPAFLRGHDPWICFPITSTANLAAPQLPPVGSPGR